jgi:NCAIR mutase (PurE)-related protein
VGDRDCGAVLVVSAGSSDLPVAEEAAETVRWMRVPVRLIQDVGVAGPHRLLQHVAEFRRVAAIVCVAGLEAALPSVLGGYAACPVIGVPTSVGYGASLGGLTAMLSMLTCCASGVVCVNIDAGFKGGYVAGMIASRTSAASVAG